MDFTPHRNRLAARCTMRCYVALVLLLSSLGFITAIDVNNVFQTLFRLPDSNATRSSERIDLELQRALEGFLNQQNRRMLERFLNATPDSQQIGLLAGIITAASKLSDAEGDAASESISALEGLLRHLPQELDAWPLVRRVAIAGLALRYGTHGPFASGTQGSAVQNILLQLHDQLRGSAKKKGVVEYAHVSKSGGTSFCRLAKANACQTEDFGYGNCLIKSFKDGPRYIDGEVHKQLQGGVETKCSGGFKWKYPRADELSCSERRRHLLDKGYNLYANEYTALGGLENPALAHSCRNMFTVLEIRHPHGRVWSHLKHMWFLYEWHCGKAAREVYFTEGHRNTSHWAALLPAPTNNYLIRSLLGEKVFNLPLGAITRQHLRLAQSFLAEQYDVVLVLEDKPLFKQTMRYGLGWGADEKHANSRREGETTREGLPQDPDTLWELNRLDVELYQFGALMARLDAVVYQAAQAVTTSASPADAAARLGNSSSSGKGSGGNGGGGRGRRLLRRPKNNTTATSGRTAGAPQGGRKAAEAEAAVGGLPACGWVGGTVR